MGEPADLSRDAPGRRAEARRRDGSQERPVPSASKRRFLARPTDRAGARRRSRWSPGGRERRSLGQPEEGKRPRRPWRRGEAAGPRSAPRHGADAEPRRRSGRLIPRVRLPARRYSLLQKNCLTPGSLRSRLIASKLGFEPVETKENQSCPRPLTDFAPMTAIPKAWGGSRSTGALPRRSSGLRTGSSRAPPRRVRAPPRRSLRTAAEAAADRPAAIFFCLQPLEKPQSSERKISKYFRRSRAVGRRGGGVGAPARPGRRSPHSPSP
jgi:hypothetical protein